MKDAIEKSRVLQIEKRRAEREANHKEEKEFAEYWKIRNVELVKLNFIFLD
jgi:hypothetical protein